MKSKPVTINEERSAVLRSLEGVTITRARADNLNMVLTMEDGREIAVVIYENSFGPFLRVGVL